MQTFNQSLAVLLDASGMITPGRGLRARSGPRRAAEHPRQGAEPGSVLPGHGQAAEPAGRSYRDPESHGRFASAAEVQSWRASSRSPAPKNHVSGSGRRGPRAGETKKGEMEAWTPRRSTRASSRWASTRSRSRRSRIEINFQMLGLGGVTRQGHPGLHPSVRDDDRRRPARWCSAWTSSPARWTTRPSRRSCSPSRRKVEQGSTFADALKDHPKVFDELFVQLCAAGEVGGILDTILNRLAALPREGREAEAQGQGRDDLPDHRHPAWPSA